MIAEDLRVIRIKSDFSITVDNYEDGTVSHKIVSPDDLGKILLDSIQNTDISSGILPKNCVAWTKSTKGEAAYYVILHAEDYADIQYHETMYPRFPIPRLVFGFRLYGERIAGVNLGVVGSGELNEKTEMYHYPFSNVSGFAMCTGANKLPAVKNPAKLANLPYYILGLPDNDDYYNAKNSKLELGHRELLEHLKDKSPDYYYSDVLIKSRRTLKDFI